jgi:hypothetical protein
VKMMTDRCIELLKEEDRLICQQDPSVKVLSELSKSVLGFIGLGKWTVLYSPSLHRDFCFSGFALLSIQTFTVGSLLELLHLCLVSVHIMWHPPFNIINCHFLVLFNKTIHASSIDRCSCFNFALVFMHSN